MKNILLIFGGKSVEHDISIITAMLAIKNLPKQYNFIPVYIDKDGHWWRASNMGDPSVYLNFMQNAKHRRAVTLVAGENRLCEVKHGRFKNSCFIDCALVCCHGGEVEGGALQGLLQLSKIPFTCPDFRASVVCMDKVLTKLQLQSSQIKVVEYQYFYYQDFLQDKSTFISKLEKSIGYPMIVKPSRLGSSVGVHICANRQEFFDALEIAGEYDEKILVEKYLSDCEEFACACMKVNDKILLSNVSQIEKEKFYSFQEKYLSSSKQSKKPSKNIQTQIKNLCLKTYSALECQGLVRIDFLRDQNKTLYVCEVNTIPGSLAFNLFDFKFEELISCLIEQALLEKASSKNLLYDFSSDAIAHYIELDSINKNTK